MQVGAITAARVELDGAAPAGGTTISLSSGNSAVASVPASVVIPAGQRSAEFIVNTNPAFQGSAVVNINATLAAVTKVATLTVYSEIIINGAITAGGPPVTVTAAETGQNFVLAFNGSVGQRVSLRLTDVTVGISSCCGASVSIKKPDGSYLVSPIQVGTSGGFIDATQLTASGTYAIVVDPNNANTGSMTLTLHDVPLDFTATLTPGGPSVSAAVTVPGQNARLTFDGIVGQRVSLKLTDITVGIGYLYIYKPDGTPLTSSTAFGTGAAFINALVLPAAGAYTILVDPSSYYTGGMTLTLYDVPPDVTGSITAGGPPVMVTTTTPGQKGSLTFDGTTGQRVSLKISAVMMNGGSGYVDVYIKKPDGTTLASDTFVSSAGGFIDVQTLPTTATYSLIVAPRDTNIGSLTLTLYDVPPDVTGTIMAGGPSVTVTTTVPGQNAQLSFNGTTGQRITLNIGGVSLAGGNGYVDVHVKKPDGTTLASKSFVSSGGGFINTQTLPVTGAYSIMVNPQGSNTGSINLTLNDVSADVIGTIVMGGSSATVTTTSVGQNAQVTFDGNAGQRVSLKISGVVMSGGNGYVDVYIKKPDGTTLASSAYVSASGGFIDTRTLPVTGTYTILVDPQGTNTGSVMLTLYEVPADVTASILPGGSSETVTTTTPGQNAQLLFAGITNQRVYLTISGVVLTGGTTNYLNVSIKKPDGTCLSSTTVAASGGFIDMQTLPADGAYTVLVDPTNASTGSATMTLYNVAADFIDTITPGGSSVTVTTTSPGQKAKLIFDGTANQRVSLKVTNVALSGSHNWATITIRKPDGTSLGSDTVDSGGGFIDTKTLPVTGTYTLLVDPWDSATGSMTLTLYNVPADVTGPITPGGSSLTVNISSPGQNATLSFNGTTNQRVSLSITAVSVSSWLRVILRKPDGTTLASATADSNGEFIDVKTLPVTGTYTVFVDPNSFSTASATLTLYDVPADATTSTTINATAVGITTAVPGQNGRVTFAGTSGQQVTVRITNNMIGSITVRLLKPDGTQQTSSSSTNSSFNLSTQTLTATGTYIVSIDPLGTRTGSIDIRVTSP